MASLVGDAQPNRRHESVFAVQTSSAIRARNTPFTVALTSLSLTPIASAHIFPNVASVKLGHSSASGVNRPSASFTLFSSRSTSFVSYHVIASYLFLSFGLVYSRVFLVFRNANMNISTTCPGRNPYSLLESVVSRHSVRAVHQHFRASFSLQFLEFWISFAQQENGSLAKLQATAFG